MVDVTPRDEAWLAIIDALRHGRDTDARTIADNAGVSIQTANRVLRVAENAEPALFTRENERDHTFRVAVGPLADVSDPEYRRLIRTAISESPE